MDDQGGPRPDEVGAPDLAVRVALLVEMDAALERLLAAVAAFPSPDTPMGDARAARDVLGHVTFWHESFARNVDDLVHGRRPTPLRGRLSDLNDRGVAEMRSLPVAEVAGRLRAAQATVRAGILSPALGLIPYRAGSRPYTPIEHLEVVRDHIQGHARGLERAADPAQRSRRSIAPR